MGLWITLILGLFIILGALISRGAEKNPLILQVSVALAFGTLLALSLLDLVPEAMEYLEDGSLWMLIGGIVVGIVLLKILDKFIPDHDSHYHHHGHAHDFTENNVTHIGIISAVAVTLHNIIEGMAVYSMAEQSLTTGALVAFGVGLHNIPMGMIIASTLRHEKKSYKYGMLGLASVSTFIGGLLMHLLWTGISDQVIGVLISITLGMIIYILFFELVPMLLHVKNWKVTIPSALAGVVLILISMQLGG